MSLYENINRRKRKGISRPKKKSTISAKAYKDMQKGFPNSKKNKAKRKRKKTKQMRTIEQDILSWSKDFLEHPNPLLGNKPVCPYAKTE